MCTWVEVSGQLGGVCPLPPPWFRDWTQGQVWQQHLHPLTNLSHPNEDIFNLHERCFGNINLKITICLNSWSKHNYVSTINFLDISTQQKCYLSKIRRNSIYVYSDKVKYLKTWLCQQQKWSNLSSIWYMRIKQTNEKTKLQLLESWNSILNL